MNLLRHFGLFLLVGTLFSCTSAPRFLTGPGPDFPDLAPALASRNVHSLLVVRHGQTLVEAYRDGWDSSLCGGGWLVPWWSAQGPETLHDVRSTTKSVVGLLAGAVLARHPEVSTALRVADFPELAARASADAQNLTLADFLGMTAGLAWKEWGHPWWDSDETALATAADPLAHALGRPATAAPGAVFRYSGGSTAVAARMLELVDGRPLEAIAEIDLWKPLGIEKVAWGRGADGRVLAFAGLGLTTRDLAKLGELVLGRGTFRAQAVVPASWIDQMLAPRAKTNTDLFDLDSAGTFYGLGWWTGTLEAGGRSVRWASTVGNGGQRAFVVPDLDLVVVLTAGDYGDPGIQRWETGFLGQILGALK